MLKLAHQRIAIPDLAFELVDLRPLPASDIDQCRDPEILDAVVAFDDGCVGLDYHEPIERRTRTEHADEIFTVPDRLSQGLRRIVFVQKAIEAGPVAAFHIG